MNYKTTKEFVYTEQWQHDLKKAIEKIRKEKNFPGFRKGNAPDSIILKKFSESIFNELGSHFLNRELDEIYKNNDVFIDPEYSVIAIDEKQFKFNIVYFSFPPVKELTFDNLTLDIVKPVLPKDALKENLKQLQEHLGEFVTVEEAISKEHHVLLSINQTTMSSPEPVVNHRLQDLLIGKKAGDHFEDNDKAVVEVLDVMKKQLPELTDQLIADNNYMTNATSLEEYKTMFKKSMLDHIKQENQNQAIKAMLEKTLADLKSEIPADFETELKQELEERKKAAEEHAKECKDEHHEHNIQGAEIYDELISHYLKLRINNMIIKEANIKIEQKDIVDFAAHYGLGQEQLEKNKDLVKRIYYILIDSKIFQYLTLKTKFNEVKEKQ